MAAIRADRALCAGYANCVMTAETYFELDDDGHVEVRRDEVPEEDRELVAEAVEACPVAALRIEG
ncbi:ferredoxin [Amycolatopsis thermophila]|jgi:ferredoxin|uniref:Phthalate 3,4-dioxygenase ferredoxin subunit n=1 Tax=Amycolatopsis thermophila TaxID=206084 RepID=A0ABU0F6Q7_9PSEU|nr:ferredoxin [Amycolatopsis thermophila]MDQ0382791.1 phthalate 3,4-dioxygenase ferredoxin subunit [Amycolatopsis thermophila]